MASKAPAVVLFGYESSAFTWKVRLVLRLKQIPYMFVEVPSMMPRPVLRDNFGITYRKIPVCAIGRDLYCDTSLIIEAIENTFKGARSIYPPCSDGRINRSMMRGFASYWTDRPFFRVMTGLIPSSVWRSNFGKDRAGLIGHVLDPDKLEKKIPRNLVGFDLHLSLFEPQFAETNSKYPWIFSTATPSHADIALFYMLKWGFDVSKGKMVENLTAGGAPDTDGEGAKPVFNKERYPATWAWHERIDKYLHDLPDVETRVTANEVENVIKTIGQASLDEKVPLVPTPNAYFQELEHKNGLKPGAEVSIAPDDTGRADPTLGTLVALSPEEVVIKPKRLDPPAKIDVRVHFPRVHFVILPVGQAKL